VQSPDSAGAHGAMHNQTGPVPSGKTCLEFALALSLGAGLATCGGGGGDTTNPPFTRPSAAARLGSQIFADTALSASGRQSCATCHLATYAFTADPTPGGPDQGLPVAIGGREMDESRFRNSPSLMYLSFSPNFYFDADGNPNGGFFRDGLCTLTDGFDPDQPESLILPAQCQAAVNAFVPP
jgi:cytochrome c peroxidase